MLFSPSNLLHLRRCRAFYDKVVSTHFKVSAFCLAESFELLFSILTRTCKVVHFVVVTKRFSLGSKEMFSFPYTE